MSAKNYRELNFLKSISPQPIKISIPKGAFDQNFSSIYFIGNVEVSRAQKNSLIAK